MNLIALAVLLAAGIAVGIGGIAIVRGEFRLSHEKTVTGQSAKVIGGICIAVAIGLVLFLAWFDGFASSRW